VPIRAYCPAGHRITVPEGFAGRLLTCPVCGMEFIIPGGLKPAGGDAAGDIPPAHGQDQGTALVTHDGKAAEDSAPAFAASATAGRQSGEDAYRATRGDWASARWGLVWLWAVCVFTAVPSGVAWAEGAGPAWAGWLLALALSQAGAAGATLIFPDWSARRGMGWVFAISAALFAYWMAVVGLTPTIRALPLELDIWRRQALHWLASLTVVHGTAAYLCFRSAEQWRRRVELVARSRRRQTAAFTAASRHGA